MVDDSVVRGTSSKIIVDSLKKAGAKKVRMVVTFPPIAHPCYMGVDFPSTGRAPRPPGRERRQQHRHASAKKVGKAIGVEEFQYNDIDGLSAGDRPPQVEHVLRLHKRRLLEAGHRPQLQDQEGDETLTCKHRSPRLRQGLQPRSDPQAR